MAAPSVPFLVFPTTNPTFIWRIVAVETNRTISLHKNLNSAIEKAERLNVIALMVCRDPFCPVVGLHNTDECAELILAGEEELARG